MKTSGTIVPTEESLPKAEQINLSQTFSVSKLTEKKEDNNEKEKSSKIIEE